MGGEGSKIITKQACALARFSELAALPRALLTMTAALHSRHGMHDVRAGRTAGYDARRCTGIMLPLGSNVYVFFPGAEEN